MNFNIRRSSTLKPIIICKYNIAIWCVCCKGDTRVAANRATPSAMFTLFVKLNGTVALSVADNSQTACAVVGDDDGLIKSTLDKSASDLP